MKLRQGLEGSRWSAKRCRIQARGLVLLQVLTFWGWGLVSWCKQDFSLDSDCSRGFGAKCGEILLGMFWWLLSGGPGNFSGTGSLDVGQLLESVLSPSTTRGMTLP